MPAALIPRPIFLLLFCFSLPVSLFLPLARPLYLPSEIEVGRRSVGRTTEMSGQMSDIFVHARTSLTCPPITLSSSNLPPFAMALLSLRQMSVDLTNMYPIHLVLVLSGRFTWPFHFPAALAPSLSV